MKREALQIHSEEGEGKEESRPRERTTEEGEPKVVFIGTGLNYSFAIREDGVLFVWGIPYNSQLGSDIPDGKLPHPIPNLKLRVPPPRTEELWKPVFSWLFLGINEKKSIFSKLNKDIVFAVVHVVHLDQ
jgi:hypothetical protein